MTDLKALEALLARRLSADEVAQLREAADRTAARAKLSVEFAAALAAARSANPAAVSRWGFA